MELLNQIKWAYQRVVNGYDERVRWGFDNHFILIIPELKEFCIDQLQQEEVVKLNPERTQIFKKTLDLIKDYETATVFNEGEFTYHSWIDQDQKLAKLVAYFGENINIYWD